MPSEKSARSAVRRQTRHQATRNAVKTSVRVARRSMATAAPEEAEVAVVQAISSLDRAAKRGALHANNASRRKSRLAKHLSTLRAVDSTL